MGIYDREYYRDETSGSGWLATSPACKWIIVINVGVLIAQIIDPKVQEWLVARSDLIFERFQLWRLLTAAFAHSLQHPFHILFNMLFLWFTGREIESMYGTRDFVAMYLTAAIASTLGWAVTDVMSETPASGGMLGASGAVLAVVVVYALYFPHREFLLFFILPVPIWLLVVIYVGFDLLFFLRGANMGVAVTAHLTGAAYGFLFKRFDLRWSRLTAGWNRPRLRVVRPEPFDSDESLSRPASGSGSPGRAGGSSSARSASAVYTPEQLEARLDEILAKIAREGRDSLTEEENRILHEASQQARNRRRS